MAEVIKQTNKKQSKDWRLLEFYVPIEESVQENKEFLIRGVAINETTTLNNVKYVAEELQKAAPTFRNVPILLDHRNEVKNIVGRTTEQVNWNANFNRIDFEAKIMDEKIQEMIKDGRIGSVSIGAKVQDLTEEKDGSMKAIGIRGLEISLVAVPGDSQANLAQAIQNSFQLKEMVMKNGDDKDKLDNKLNNMEENLMAEDEQKSVEVPEEKKEEVKNESAEETKEEDAEEKEEASETSEKTQNINVSVDNSDLKSQIAELKSLLQTKKKIQEDADEEKEDETKGEVSTDNDDALEKLNNSIVETANKGLALYKDYSKEGADTKLNRLVR